MVVGDPSQSKTQVLEAVFLDDVTLVLDLTSRCFWVKVTDEPAMLSACMMVRTRFWRILGSGPNTWDPSKGAVLTVERTWGLNQKFFRRASRRSNWRFDADVKPADTTDTWASCIMASFSLRSSVCCPWEKVLRLPMPPWSLRVRRILLASWPTPQCLNTSDVKSVTMKEPCYRWSCGHMEVSARIEHHDWPWDGMALSGIFALPWGAWTSKKMHSKSQIR